LTVLKNNASDVDLPSYDLLLDRFVKGDWGHEKPRSPVQMAQRVVEFLQITQDLNITLNKEQLCKLVLECYGEVVEMAPPYTRIEAIATVANIEKKSCLVIGQEAYLDDLHDFYEREVALAK